MSNLIEMWFFVAAINLGILTYQDFKHNMLVDDRINTFLYGLSFAIPVYLHKSFLWIVILIILTLILRWVFTKAMAMGEADINAMNWIIFGLGMINPYTFAIFTGFFMASTLLYFFIKTRIFKINMHVESPFFIVIFLSFLVTWVFFTPFFFSIFS